MVQKYGNSCKFQDNFSIFAPNSKADLTAHHKTMEIYMTPETEVIGILPEGSILTGSTGESFNDQEDFGGSWS